MADDRELNRAERIERAKRMDKPTWNRQTAEELARLLKMRCACDLSDEPLICGRCRRIVDIEAVRPHIYETFGVLRTSRAAAQTKLLAVRLQNEQLTREALELREQVERLTKERDEARRLFERATLGYAHSDEIESLGAELQRLRDALTQIVELGNFAIDYDDSVEHMQETAHRALSGSPEPAPDACPACRLTPGRYINGNENLECSFCLGTAKKPACKTCNGKELMPNGETCTECLGYDSAAPAEKGKEKR